MNNYTVIKYLGSGSFGTVNLAENKDNKELVVIKEEVFQQSLRFFNFPL